MYPNSDCNIAIVENVQEVDQQSFQCNGKTIEFSATNFEFNKSVCTPDGSSQLLKSSGDDKNSLENQCDRQSKLRNSQNSIDSYDTSKDVDSKFLELKLKFEQIDKSDNYKRLELNNIIKPCVYDQLKKINIERKNIMRQQRMMDVNERQRIYAEVCEEIDKLRKTSPDSVEVIEIHNVFLKLLSCANGDINKSDNKKINEIMIQESDSFRDTNKSYNYNEEEANKLLSRIKFVHKRYVYKKDENRSLAPVVDIESIFHDAKFQYNVLPQKDPDQQLKRLIKIVDTKPEIFENVKSVKELPKYAQATFKSLEKSGWPKQHLESNEDTRASKEFNKNKSEIFPKSNPRFYWEYDINKGVNVSENVCMVRGDLFCPKKRSQDEYSVYERVLDQGDNTIQAYYIDNDVDEQGNPENIETYGTITKSFFRTLDSSDVDRQNMSNYYFKMIPNRRRTCMRDGCRFINTDCGVVFFTNNHHKTYKYFVKNKNNAYEVFTQFINNLGSDLMFLNGFFPVEK